MASSPERKRSFALVDYSDSDDDAVGPPAELSSSPKKLRRESKDKDAVSSSLPPLPSKFHDLYTTNPRLTKDDDPSAHGGRHRAIPHVEGNWPTHIYFEWHLNSTEISKIGGFIETAQNVVRSYEQFHKSEDPFKLESFLYSDLGTQLPLHISMSRPIVLRTEERDGFVAMLEKGLKRVSIEPFDVRFTALEWVANQDRTRWFWVLRGTSPVPIGRRQHSLSMLLSMSNQVAKAYKQPGLYLTDDAGKARDGFHVSIGWSLKEPSERLRQEIATAIAEYQSQISELSMRCDALKAKIGNAVHVMELKQALTMSTINT